MILDMAASGHGERTAFGLSGSEVTFAQLGEGAALGASVLRGLSAGHVVFIGRNGPALPLLLFASAEAGLPFTPLNYRLSQKQIFALLDSLHQPVVVADEDYLPAVVGRYPAMSTDVFQERSRDASTENAVNVPDTDVAVELFTSGTTSRPKAVLLRHENLVAYVLTTVEFGSAVGNEAALVTIPPYHVAAVSSALSNTYAGRRVVYLPDFDPGVWLRLVREECITTAMVVPTMLARIVDRLAGAQAQTPSLELISYGGARMPRSVLERALVAFPDAGFCNAYGLTETSSTLALLGPEDHREALASADNDVRVRLSSVGRAVPGVELQIRDAAGAPVAEGLRGELWVRGAQVSGEYVGQGSALDGDGWFPTRDRAWLDSDGYLFIGGRSDDIIIRGGENIAPAEIEDVLGGHPAVKDVAVVGRADDEWGEVIVAFVVPYADTSPSVEELQDWVRNRLRSSRTPDRIIWSGELPYSPTGKLLRRELRAP